MTTSFEIIDGVPVVGDRRFPWAYSVHDNLEFPRWPWVEFVLRLESGWDLGARWCRVPRSDGGIEPDGKTAIVYCEHQDTALAIHPDLPTHVLETHEAATPDTFLDLLERAGRIGPGPDHLLPHLLSNRNET